MSHPSALILGGRSGLLGRALARELTAGGWRVTPVGRQDFDPWDSEALRQALEAAQATVLVNAVAYTAVDKAEDEPEAAQRLNAELPGHLARAARQHGASLVHFSTDFVFDGQGHTPYSEDAPTRPLSVYGATKLAGERAVAEAGVEALVVRLSWLFGPGKVNFVEKILGLAGQRESLRVVSDQRGSPGYTPELAVGVRRLLETGAQGVYHLACGGATSWHGLAAEAVALAGLPCRVEPIATSQYPTRAVRPAYSVLGLDKYTRTTGHTPRPWDACLAEYVRRDLGLGAAD